MSKEKTTPEVPVLTDPKATALTTLAADPIPPAVLLFGRYVKLLKGEPEKVWNYFNLELARCQPGVIL
ncbi:hypothetical protein [Chitinophaga sp.]|uniref:hypothetical protein n=1 Tax=Chitinophaga sp. TaxID=1869181 RepID=UPI0031CF4000